MWQHARCKGKNFVLFFSTSWVLELRAYLYEFWRQFEHLYQHSWYADRLKTDTFQMSLQVTCLTVPPTLNHRTSKPSSELRQSPNIKERGCRLYDLATPSSGEKAGQAHSAASRLVGVLGLFEGNCEKENCDPRITKPRSSRPQVPTQWTTGHYLKLHAPSPNCNPFLLKTPAVHNFRS
jgi:hypothetical protein